MEEKNGRIVEIVESTEVQKQQKKNKRSLRIMIASLILAGSMGYGAMNLSQGDSKEGQPVVNVNTDYHISSELDGVEISNISTNKDSIEDAKTNPSLYAVVTTEDGKTTVTSYALTSDMNKVKLEDNQKLMLIEKFEQEKEHPICLFQKQTRTVSTTEENNLAPSGEWQATDEYIIGYSVPASSLDTRYIFTGTLDTVLENSPVVELPHVMLDSELKKINSELSSTTELTEHVNEKIQDKVDTFNEYAQNVTSQDTLTDDQRVALSQQAQNTIKSIYDDKFNSLQDYQESVQPNQPSFPSIQSPVFDKRQQFLDKINKKITEMNQMLDNTDVNEQSVSEGKTR